MKDEDIRNLLGGFATGTLTAHERELLFTASLRDQELFNALADEEVLREFLSDPASRRRLLELLQPAAPGVVERLTSWVRRPAAWAVAGTVMAVLLVAVALRRPQPPPMEMAKQAPAGYEDRVAAVEEKPLNAPAPAKRERAAAAKMKVAVLDFDSAKEADSRSKDIGKTASDLLGKKLDSSGYAVIDRKQVDKALQDQNLSHRQLDPATAASLGRSIGADTVIVGSVKPAAESIQVNATAINTQTAANVGNVQGGQAPGNGLAGAMDQVASSLGQQMLQNTRNRVEGYITAVNSKILTLSVGARSGVKPGDRFEVRRLGKPFGRVLINTVQDTSSVGVFEGAETPRYGDTIANP